MMTDDIIEKMNDLHLSRNTPLFARELCPVDNKFELAIRNAFFLGGHIDAWNCQRCTFENKSYKTICEVCESERFS